MKRIVAVLASVAVLVVAPQAASQEAVPPAGSTTEMQGTMSEMQALMERVRNTQDPAERQRLMAEHMRLMHEGMMMMGGPAGNQRSQQPCADNDSQCRMQRMQAQQGMMSQRMGMMQMMMVQMMDHMMQHDTSAEPPTPSTAPEVGGDGQSHEQHH